MAASSDSANIAMNAGIEQRLLESTVGQTNMIKESPPADDCTSNYECQVGYLGAKQQPCSEKVSSQYKSISPPCQANYLTNAQYSTLDIGLNFPRGYCPCSDSCSVEKGDTSRYKILFSAMIDHEEAVWRLRLFSLQNQADRACAQADLTAIEEHKTMLRIWEVMVRGLQRKAKGWESELNSQSEKIRVWLEYATQLDSSDESDSDD